MKKFLIIIVFLFGLFLVGCSSENNSSIKEKNETEKKVVEQKVITIESSEPYFGDDPSTFERLFIENHTIVVEAKIESKLESKYLQKSEHLIVPGPVTPIKLGNVEFRYGYERPIDENFCGWWTSYSRRVY